MARKLSILILFVALVLILEAEIQVITRITLVGYIAFNLILELLIYNLAIC